MTCEKAWRKVNEMRLKVIKNKTSQWSIRTSPRETIFAQIIKGWTLPLHEVGSNEITMRNGLVWECFCLCGRQNFQMSPRIPTPCCTLISCFHRGWAESVTIMWIWWDGCSGLGYQSLHKSVRSPRKVCRGRKKKPIVS